MGETVMYEYQVDLIDRWTCWKGSKGVVMHCKISWHKVHHQLLAVIPDMGEWVVPVKGVGTQLDVTVWGVNEPTVWVKAMDASNSYVYPTIITDPAINNDVRQWLDTSPVLAEWYEEATRYRAALSKVDLPYQPEDVQSEGKYLTYRFAIEGGREYDIQVVLEVAADNTRATIGLQEAGNDDRYVHVGTTNIAGDVTPHKVRSAVGDTLFDFIGDMRDLVRVVIHGSW